MTLNHVMADKLPISLKAADFTADYIKLTEARPVLSPTCM